MGISNHVIITGRIPHSQVPRYLAASDIGLIFMSDDLANKTRVSFKLLEYLSMNLQVVGHIVGESRDSLGEYCFLCQPTPESMADLALDVTQKDLRKESGRRFIKENYDWSVVGKSLEQALKRVQN
jgi:glycosyltransferase involved in cell wall biosynthesis